MQRKNIKWTTEEDQLLREQYYSLGASAIAKLLKRTKKACVNRVYHLNNLEKTKLSGYHSKKWTEEEIKILKENYSAKGAVWCSKKIGKSKESCIAKAGSLNIKRDYHWTKEEEDIIKQYYPKYGSLKVSKLLGRNRNVCMAKASELGIKYIFEDRWSEEEDNFLRKYYPSKDTKYVAKYLKRSETACKSRAAVLKIRKEERWTLEEIKFLYEHYAEKGPTWVAKQLKKKSINCRNYASKHHLKYDNPKKWTKKEISILKKYYPIIGKYVSELLPKRNMRSCMIKAVNLNIAYQQKYSSPVEKIKQILLDNHIDFKQEVGFRECKDKNILLFDFGIYKENQLMGLIEYDGVQHFFETNVYRSHVIPASVILKTNQRHDHIKNEFCKRKQIPLLRIKYTQENIEKQVLEFIHHLNLFLDWYNLELSYQEYYNYDSKEVSRLYYNNWLKVQKDYKSRTIPDYVVGWTEEEDKILTKYYPDKGSKYVASLLNRTSEACICRANRLGLHRSGKWTKKEDAYILRYYKEKGPLEIAKHLNRTVSSINHRARRINADKLAKSWTKEEDQVLIDYYLVMTKDELAKKLNRSFSSIDNRIRKLKQKGILYNNSQYLKMLTVREPYASLISENKINIYITKMKLVYCGEIYIHASNSKLSKKELQKYQNTFKKKIKYGYILSKVKVLDCIRINEKNIKEMQAYPKEYINHPLVIGYYVWIFSKAELVKDQIKLKGKVGVWKYKV